MLPDNLLGGLLLSIVNMSVCFVVLGFLALVIKLVAGVLGAKEGAAVSEERVAEGSAAGIEAEPVRAPESPGPVGQVAGVAGGTSDLTPEEKAAAMAAVMVVMARAGCPVFVRGLTDSGAWGGLGKPRALEMRKIPRQA